MFESTLSAQGLNDGERRLGPLSAAVFGHVALISMIVAVTAMVVPPVQDPKPSEALVIALRPPDPDLGPTRSGAPRPKKGTDTAGTKRSVVPPPPVQPPAPPVETPETPSTADDASASVDPDGSVDGTPGLPDGTGLDTGEGQGGVEEGDGGGGAGPVPFSAEMVKPVLLTRVEPIYPDVARIARLQGRVIVQAVIGLDGDVESAEILSSTSPLFDDAARSAVLRWRYRPALMNGRPVRIYFTVVVQFSIR